MLAFVTDDNPLLPLALDPDDGVHAIQSPLDLPLLDAHGRGVGHFLVQVAHHLLANQLRQGEALIVAHRHVFRIERRAFTGAVEQLLGQGLKLHPPQRRDGHDEGETMQALQSLQRGQQPGLVVHAVDHVHHQADRRRQALETIQHLLVFVGPAVGIDHEQHHVDVFQRRKRRVIHHPVERAFAVTVDARRVHEYQLSARVVHHALNLVTRGLRLVADDADLAAHQRIDQRRLAHIGATHHGDHGAKHGVCSR